jgi:hypothetical protein
MDGTDSFSNQRLMDVLKLFFIVLLLFSCNKEDNGVNTTPKADFSFSDKLDYFELKSTSVDADGDKLTYEWISTDDKVEIHNPYAANIYIYLPELSDTQQVAIQLIVNDDQSSDSVTKYITLPKTTEERLFGLGMNLKYAHCNNVNYDWYSDQMNTGIYSAVNCGPTSVSMALKWVDPDFDKTPEDARNTYRTGGGWWYTDDIINYLNLYSANNFTIDITHIDSVQRQLDDGHIAILCLDIYYVRFQSNPSWHVDKFYFTSNTGSGHFIVIKGYKVVDHITYYEVYDPASMGASYSDHTLKGKDRYYRSEDLNSAVLNWWKYAIIVSKSNSKSAIIGVDTDQIIHKPGM